MEQTLTDYLEDYLSKDENFKSLDEEEQFKIYHVYQRVLITIYQVCTYKNVHPLLYVKDIPSAQLLEKALTKLTKTIPAVKRIEIIIVN
jgi:hypothetical protein